MSLVHISKRDMNSTIKKTLLTANLFDGFWDRWLVHGVESADLSSIRQSYLTKDVWIQGWYTLAEKKDEEAESLKMKGAYEEAEMKYRISALYYQLIQWLIPEYGKEKLDWLNISLNAVRRADQLSFIDTKYVELTIDRHLYFGRVRIPARPKGVILIINPLDSTKEELFTYEKDFAEKDYITVSFDGPGQGQTYAIQGVRGTTNRWKRFVDGIIDYAFTTFQNRNIYLFGTSSGAAWAIYGSCNPKVTKAVAVSPAFITGDIQLPDYFLERSHFVLEEDEILPAYHELSYKNPVLLVHGKKDVMVKDEHIYDLYERLPNGKSYLEYEEEGHCCNYKWPEIRQKASEWFQGEWGWTNEF